MERWINELSALDFLMCCHCSWMSLFTIEFFTPMLCYVRQTRCRFKWKWGKKLYKFAFTPWCNYYKRQSNSHSRPTRFSDTFATKRTEMIPSPLTIERRLNPFVCFPTAVCKKSYSVFLIPQLQATKPIWTREFLQNSGLFFFVFFYSALVWKFLITNHRVFGDQLNKGTQSHVRVKRRCAWICMQTGLNDVRSLKTQKSVNLSLLFHSTIFGFNLAQFFLSYLRNLFSLASNYL